MSLRVAFDLDGTIADMYAALHKEAEKLFGAEALAVEALAQKNNGPDADDDGESKKVMAELHLSAKQQMQLWDHVKTVENFWRKLPELDSGIVARLWNLVVTRRWEVIFLTTRPLVAGETVQIQSQRWLKANGFLLPSVFVVQRSRGKIADALHLDAVVDDRPENCLDVAVESKAKPILIWPADPEARATRREAVGRTRCRLNFGSGLDARSTGRSAERIWRGPVAQKAVWQRDARRSGRMLWIHYWPLRCRVR